MREVVIRGRVHEAIKEQVFPGCVIGLHVRGMTEILPFGRYCYEEDSPAVTKDSLYDCASLTKSIPTATLSLQLIDEGKLSLDDPLITYIPEYRTKHREHARIHHLLTYTLGNTTPLSFFKDKTTDEIFEAVCTEKSYAPNTIFSYSNTPAFLLGIVIERILNMSLDKAADERIFKPLAMNTTTFSPHGAVSTEEGVVDIVHDESARVFAREGKVVGHAGLFSTAPDILRFCEALLSGTSVLREDTIERMTINQIAHLNKSTGLGFELDQPFMGEQRSPRTFGKTGFTGTSFVCDRERGIAVVILSNRTYPKRGKDAVAINHFRRGLCDILFTHE